MKFESGITRMGAFNRSINDIEIKRNWKIFILIPFPVKSDFKDQNEIKIKMNNIIINNKSGPLGPRYISVAYLYMFSRNTLLHFHMIHTYDYT